MHAITLPYARRRLFATL